MGLFDILRGKKPEIMHSVFGRIVYQGNSTWECGRGSFAPVGHNVEVIIHAGPEGPGEKHVVYWQEVIARWPDLKRACDPIVRKALVDWIDTPEKGDIWSRIDVECIDVFPGTPPDEWEFMLWCPEAGHWPVFVMHRWTPTSCFVDG